MNDAVTTPAGDGSDGAQPSPERVVDIGEQMRSALAKRRDNRAAAKPDAERDERDGPDEVEQPDVERDEAEAEPEAEPEDDAKSHWAKKIKGELEAAQRKVAEYDGRMRHLAEGARAARDRIADLSVAADHHKAYAEWLEKQIDLAGYEIPQVQRDLFAQRLELSTLKAQRDRGRGAQDEARVSQMADQIKARVADVVKKFPDLDPQRSPEARAFWETRLAVSPDPKVPAPSLDDIERHAEAWAMIRRGQRLMDDERKRKPPAAPKRPEQRPGIAGQRGAAGKPTPQKQAPVTARTMIDYLAKKRAARGA